MNPWIVENKLKKPTIYKSVIPAQGSAIIASAVTQHNLVAHLSNMRQSNSIFHININVHPHKMCYNKCNRCYSIDRLPVNIKRSGTYCITKNLTFMNTIIPAITVSANYVNICFGGHIITIDTLGTGISATNVSNLSVYGGKITALTSDSSMGISLTSVQNFSLDQMMISNIYAGCVSVRGSNQNISNCDFDTNTIPIMLHNCMAITIDKSHIENIIVFPTSIITGIGIFADSSEMVSVTNCTIGAIPENNQFYQTGNIVYGIIFSNCSNIQVIGSDFQSVYTAILINENCVATTISNCLLSDIYSAWIYLDSQSGTIIEGCSMNINRSNDFAGIQIGIDNSRDVIIRDCIIDGSNGASGYDNIFIGASSGIPISNILIENCILRTNSIQSDAFYIPANIHFFPQYNNNTGPNIIDGIKIKNCIISGQQIGVFIDGLQGTGFFPSLQMSVEIDNCLIDRALTAGVLSYAGNNIVIKNSDITGTTGTNLNFIDSGGSGIILTGGSTNNTIKNNIITNNATDGIDVGITGPADSFNMIIDNIICNNGGNGINIVSNNNSVKNNTLDNNIGNGILNTGSNNFIINNTAGNNIGGDYDGVLYTVSQGAPPITGGNIYLL